MPIEFPLQPMRGSCCGPGMSQSRTTGPVPRVRGGQRRSPSPARAGRISLLRRFAVEGENPFGAVPAAGAEGSDNPYQSPASGDWLSLE